MATIEKSLNEYLERDLFRIEQEIPNKEPFVIDDKQTEVWAVKKIARLTAEMKENQDIANNEIERIRTWIEEANRPNTQSIEYLTSLLEGYHRKLFAEDDKQKTIKLPHGTLKLRSQQPEWVKNDEGLIEYFREAGDYSYIETIDHLKWGLLKQLISVADDGTVVDAETGEVFDRELIHAIPRGPKFSVEVIE